MASPHSTGGGGTHFETRVAASCFAAVLCEALMLLKRGGFYLLPTPPLVWLPDAVQRKKADQAFRKADGDETVDLLRELITEKGGALSSEDRKTIILASDILTDNGVRGAGFLHQELLRSE